MKKKFLALALTAVMALSLAACGGDTQSTDTDADTSGDESASGSQTYTVGIIQQVQHEALDAATQGFQDALTELLVCGECGSPYKRVTWARDGKKRIVWRCVSRLEFGTKYCHASPTLDEGKPHSAILNAMNEYAAIRQEVCPDVLAMVEEAKQALTQTGTKLLTLKRRLDEVSHEQADLLDMLLSNMADADLNARMKALTDEKASLKEQILEAQQEEVGLEEQVAKRQQMWDSLIECSEGYTEFDDEFVRQIIQKITVEDADTIRIQFRDSDVVLEQGLQ